MKGKKDKNRVFVVELKHDGIFCPNPFSYIHGDEKQLTEFDFEGMSYDHLRELIVKFVHSPIHSLYYCKVGKTLKQGLCRLNNDNDVSDFIKAGYESNWIVELYVEHHGYEAMDYKNARVGDYESSFDSDAYCSDNEDDVIEGIELFHEGEDAVVIRNRTTNDPFLSKLCCNKGTFRGFLNDPIPTNEEPFVEDMGSNGVHPMHKVQRGIAYPRHDPSEPWNEMKPILGMKFDHPEQLKLCLANYGVAGGYPLWFKKNDWKELLVCCGRNVSTGMCAGYHAKTSKAKKKLFTDSPVKAKGSKKPTNRKCKKKGKTGIRVGKVKTCSPHGEGTSKDGEGSSGTVSPKWTKSKIVTSRGSMVPQCPFRLWASWMSYENSFQIKSLIPQHKCARNYNLGSLVTYRWIAHQLAKDIIADPFMPLLKMQTMIKEKFMLKVSLGQCKRAKQRALYDFEGGLKEHYARLWEYRHAILVTNPGSTCVIDDEETGYGNTYFRRMYMCFKGIKDGWLAGCRKVISLDGCFLKHTCRGELLTAIGRDANNQMYPIVVFLCAPCDACIILWSKNMGLVPPHG